MQSVEILIQFPFVGRNFFCIQHTACSGAHSNGERHCCVARTPFSHLFLAGLFFLANAAKRQQLGQRPCQKRTWLCRTWQSASHHDAQFSKNKPFASGDGALISSAVACRRSDNGQHAHRRQQQQPCDCSGSSRTLRVEPRIPNRAQVISFSSLHFDKDENRD